MFRCFLCRYAAFELPYLMEDPVRSMSLKEFWGRRWDTVLQSLLKDYVYVPLRKSHGFSRAAAGFTTFFCSGLGHTLPIANGLGDLKMMFAMLLYFVVEFVLLWVQEALSRGGGRVKPVIPTMLAQAITLVLVLLPAPLFLIPALCLAKWCPRPGNLQGLEVMSLPQFWSTYAQLTMLLVGIVGAVRCAGFGGVASAPAGEIAVEGKKKSVSRRKVE